MIYTDETVKKLIIESESKKGYYCVSRYGVKKIKFVNYLGNVLYFNNVTSVNTKNDAVFIIKLDFIFNAVYNKIRGIKK